MTPDSYLREMLADGARPFRHRSAVSELLGVPGDAGVRVSFGAARTGSGFAYLRQERGGDTPAAASGWWSQAMDDVSQPTARASIVDEWPAPGPDDSIEAWEVAPEPVRRPGESESRRLRGPEGPAMVIPGVTTRPENPADRTHTRLDRVTERRHARPESLADRTHARPAGLADPAQARPEGAAGPAQARPESGSGGVEAWQDRRRFAAPEPARGRPSPGARPRPAPDEPARRAPDSTPESPRPAGGESRRVDAAHPGDAVEPWQAAVGRPDRRGTATPIHPTASRRTTSAATERAAEPPLGQRQAAGPSRISAARTAPAPGSDLADVPADPARPSMPARRGPAARPAAGDPRTPSESPEEWAAARRPAQPPAPAPVVVVRQADAEPGIAAFWERRHLGRLSLRAGVLR